MKNNTEKEFKDFVGNVLKIGDEVVYSTMESSSLKRGKVVKFMNVKIGVEVAYGKRFRVINKSSEDVIKNPNVWEII